MAFVQPALPFSSRIPHKSNITCKATNNPNSPKPSPRSTSKKPEFNRAKFLKIFAASTILLPLTAKSAQAKGLFGLELPKISLPSVKLPGFGGGGGGDKESEKMESKKGSDENMPLQMSGKEGEQADEMMEKLRNKTRRKVVGDGGSGEGERVDVRGESGSREYQGEIVGGSGGGVGGDVDVKGEKEGAAKAEGDRSEEIVGRVETEEAKLAD